MRGAPVFTGVTFPGTPNDAQPQALPTRQAYPCVCQGGAPGQVRGLSCPWSPGGQAHGAAALQPPPRAPALPAGGQCGSGARAAACVCLRPLGGVLLSLSSRPCPRARGEAGEWPRSQQLASPAGSQDLTRPRHTQGVRCRERRGRGWGEGPGRGRPVTPTLCYLVRRRTGMLKCMCC